MINILVMPLALEPTEHKYDGLLDQGLSISTNIIELLQDKEGDKKLQYQTWEVSHSLGRSYL